MASAGRIPVDHHTAQRFLNCWLVGNLAGAVAYGVSITLAWNCLILLSKSSGDTSRRMRRVLMILITFMCLIATVGFILTTGGVVEWSSNPSTEAIVLSIPAFWGNPFSPVELNLIVLATWCSDGFMIWRCIILYSGVSRLRRTIVLGFVTLLTLTSLGSGFCALVTVAPAAHWTRYGILSLFEIISLVVNGSISILIVFRILYHQRFLRSIFGSEYASPYTRVMSILIESASLTLLVSLGHIVLAAGYGRVDVVDSPESMVIVKLMTQINTISPILIIFRVAQGRSWKNDLTKSFSANGTLDVEQIHSMKFAANELLSAQTGSGQYSV